MKTIFLIGAGNMGFAMLAGWLKFLDDTYRFAVIDRSPSAALTALQTAESHRLSVATSACDLPSDMVPSAIVLATKPQGVCAALEAVADRFVFDTVVVSVAAGLSLDQIRQSPAAARAVVRVMPNIGALVGKSASAGISTEETTVAQRALVATLFEALGCFSWLTREEDMHLVTALSGSGPAYFFAMCEAMIETAVRSGLDRAVAETLVQATCSAAGSLLEQTPDARLLRQQVTSPNGTTAAGLAALAQDGRLQSVMDAAIKAARDRSTEMA